MDLAPVRRRLAAWNLLVFGLVLAVTIGTAAVGAWRVGEAAVDDALRAGAARAAARLEHERLHERRERRERAERAERAEHAEPDDDDGALDGLIVITQRVGAAAVRSNRRAAPPGLPDRQALDAALRGETVFSARVAGGEPLRLLSVPVMHEGRLLGAVQVARSVADRRRAVAGNLLVLIATGLAGLLLAATGSAFLAGRAMRPIADALDRQRRFIADAGHELRTPVAVLRARAELLAREGEALPAALRDEAARLQRDAEELSDLLGELLDLARLDAADEAIPLSPAALDELVEEVAAQLAPLAEPRGVRLTARAQPVWASTNLGRIRQVLRALADNALKHTPAGGTVVLEASREGDRACLRVRDDGEGIAPEHLPRVFDRFYRADPARGRGGAGLGLAIAAQLVRRLRGEVTLESELGRGTTVTVRLPLADAAKRGPR